MGFIERWLYWFIVYDFIRYYRYIYILFKLFKEGVLKQVIYESYVLLI